MNKSIRLLLTLLIMLFNSHRSIAQKIKLEDDMIKVDGIPYAIMKKKSAGLLRNDFIVSSLSGTELIYFKSALRPWYGSGYKYGSDNELYFEVNFLKSGSKADLKHYNSNGFAKLVVENNLIKENYIDIESEKKFIQVYNGYYPYNPDANKTPAVVVNINNSNNSTPATTNTKSKTPITITGNQIIREGIVIGKFNQPVKSPEQKAITITIYNEGGEKIAEATVPSDNPQEWTIKTLSDNKTTIIMYDTPNEKEKLFKWLADKNYLTN